MQKKGKNEKKKLWKNNKIECCHTGIFWSFFTNGKKNLFTVDSLRPQYKQTNEKKLFTAQSAWKNLDPHLSI
jgi:hypothetical protein